MHASVSWLNSLLSPGGLSAAALDDALTSAGFPIESHTELADGDVTLDVEVTSNRGDCLSLMGLAREVAAVRKQSLVGKAASPREGSGGAGATDGAIGLSNQVPEVCPLFTVRVIRGVTVGPSPAWLVKRLESVGQRSINNVVDATNYISFLLGNPTHVFDLAKLEGKKLIVRYAAEGEKLTTLDGKARTLKADELVVADAVRAQSLAGVMGGQDSEVSTATTDVAVEVATWDPVTVRRASRRHGIRTDASHRFERIVPAGTLAAASDELCALILEIAGGTLLAGNVSQGREVPPARRVKLRPARLNDYLGYSVATEDAAATLRSLGFEVNVGADGMECTVPVWRTDIVREVDLIEEVARTRGLDAIPTNPTMGVVVKPPQEDQRAMRELAASLNGLGFFETVTFTFVNQTTAAPFLAGECGLIEVDDDLRKADPTLRPSVLPSLLACRRGNQDAKNDTEEGLRLFETASVFMQMKERSHQARMLAMVMDVPPGDKEIDRAQGGVRAMRAVVERVVRALGGPRAALEIEPGACKMQAFDGAAHAHVKLNGAPIGHYGLITRRVQEAYGLERGVVAAELDVAALIAMYPPLTSIVPLAAFPAIERDISFIVSETVTWGSIAAMIAKARIDRLEAIDFLYTYRGKQIGAGKKSVTARLRFRDAARTLRREEVDPQVASVTAALHAEVGAEVRTG
jgi:phenylalanyl-tRNA synthetase beta chain